MNIVHSCKYHFYGMVVVFTYCIVTVFDIVGRIIYTLPEIGLLVTDGYWFVLGFRHSLAWCVYGMGFRHLS